MDRAALTWEATRLNRARLRTDDEGSNFKQQANSVVFVPWLYNSAVTEFKQLECMHYVTPCVKHE